MMAQSFCSQRNCHLGVVTASMVSTQQVCFQFCLNLHHLYIFLIYIQTLHIKTKMIFRDKNKICTSTNCLMFGKKKSNCMSCQKTCILIHLMFSTRKQDNFLSLLIKEKEKKRKERANHSSQLICYCLWLKQYMPAYITRR